MQHPFICDKVFKGIDYTATRLTKAEYENCVFEGCNFSEGDLANQNFMECTFIDCNLSNVNVTGTIFKEVVFQDCKLLGAKFNTCNTFFISFSFEHCSLNFASFYQLKMKNTRFSDCSLLEVDFVETDLTGSRFDNCDLAQAIFENTVLEKVDFKTARNYAFDPEINRLKKARFSTEGIAGLLKKYDIVIDQ